MRTLRALSPALFLTVMAGGVLQGGECFVYPAAPPAFRAEGLAEALSPIIVQCRNVAAPANTLIDVQVVLNTEESSRLLNSATQGTEALLIVKE